MKTGLSIGLSVGIPQVWKSDQHIPNQHQSSNVLESTRLLRLLKTGRASRPSQLFWPVLLCSSLWCCLCLLSAKLRKSQRTCQPNNQRSKQRSRQGELGYPMWCCWHCWFLHWPQGWSSNFSPSSSSTSMACLLSRSAWFKPLSPWWRLASPTWWVFVLRWLVEPKPPVSVWSGSLDASLAYRYKERKERICYHHWLSSCSEEALPKHLLLLLGQSWWIAYLHPRGVDGAAAVPYLGSERSESVETMLNHDKPSKSSQNTFGNLKNQISCLYILYVCIIVMICTVSFFRRGRQWSQWSDLLLAKDSDPQASANLGDSKHPKEICTKNGKIASLIDVISCHIPKNNAVHTSKG